VTYRLSLLLSLLLCLMLGGATNLSAMPSPLEVDHPPLAANGGIGAHTRLAQAQAPQAPDPAAAPAQAPTQAPVDEPIGNVATLTGSASVIRNSVTTPLKLKDDIFFNDTVQTTANSTLGITFNDATTFNLKASSKMTIDNNALFRHEKYKELRGELRDLELHHASLETLRVLVMQKLATSQLESLEQEAHDALTRRLDQQHPMLLHAPQFARRQRPELARDVVVALGESRDGTATDQQHARFDETGSHLRRRVSGVPDMLLGSDFLRAHRVLIAHSQRKMYFSYTGGTVFPEAPGKPCSADKN